MVMSIKESKEFVLFEAFAKNSSFEEALSAVEVYDRDKTSGKILTSMEDKVFLLESYKIFCDAKKMLKKRGGAPDYENLEHVTELKNGVRRLMPAASRVMFKEDTSSLAMMKANIGRMLDTHIKNLRTIGPKELAAQKKQMAEEEKKHRAMTEKHGRVGFGGYESGRVFSTEKKYKSINEILRERMSKEQSIS